MPVPAPVEAIATDKRRDREKAKRMRHPFRQASISRSAYCCVNFMARAADDFAAIRSRLAWLDAAAALLTTPLSSLIVCPV